MIIHSNQVTSSSKFAIQLVVSAIVFLVIVFGLRIMSDQITEKNAIEKLKNAIIPTALASETEQRVSIVSLSNKEINALPNKNVTITVVYKNTGTADLPNLGDFLFLAPSKSSLQFHNNFWMSKNKVSRISHKIVPTQRFAMKFTLRTPETTGRHVASFSLKDANGNYIAGSEFDIPVNVSLDTSKPAPTKPRPQTQTSATQKKVVAGISSKSLNVLENEPDIRVGITYREDKRVVITSDGPFALYSFDGVKQRVYGAGSLLEIVYRDGAYIVSLPIGKVVFTKPVTIKSVDNRPLIINNYEWGVSWNSKIKDNAFLGKLEINYNPATDRLWVINIIPLEEYVSGISEVSNINVPELHKALSVAARTYALYYYLNNNKYNGLFNVRDDIDQVYRGYYASKRHPIYTKAVNDTRGQVITYDGNVVITPYFTQSDGRTKSFREVWGSYISTPHLQSVTVEQDKGRRLIGHGVGMSIQGAQRMAYLEGKDYMTILKHFYTNTDIQMAYY